MNFDSMNLYNVDDLTPHLRNKEFFDDMTGERWEDFLESVMTSQQKTNLNLMIEGKTMKLKEWIYAIFIAIMINGYCKFELTMPQRLLFLWFLWFVCVCLIYKAEDLIDWVKGRCNG